MQCNVCMYVCRYSGRFRSFINIIILLSIIAIDDEYLFTFGIFNFYHRPIVLNPFAAQISNINFSLHRIGLFNIDIDGFRKVPFNFPQRSFLIFCEGEIGTKVGVSLTGYNVRCFVLLPESVGHFLQIVAIPLCNFNQHSGVFYTKKSINTFIYYVFFLKCPSDDTHKNCFPFIIASNPFSLTINTGLFI